MAAPRKNTEVQNKYDSLLLNTIQKIDDKMDDQTSKLKDISYQTFENKEAIKNVNNTVIRQNSRIAKLEGKVESAVSAEKTVDIGSNKWLIAFLSSVILALIAAGVFR